MKIIKLKPLLHTSIATLALLTSIMTPKIIIAAPHVTAGTVIQNQVIVTYKDIYGNAYTDESNIIKITIREVNSAILTNTSGEVRIVGNTPNSLVYSAHSLQNTGNATDTYDLTASNTAIGDTLDATEILIYLDTNGNGQLDDDEKTPLTHIELAPDALVKLIITSKLPAVVAKADTLNVLLNAQSQKDKAVNPQNLIKINFSDAQPKIDVVLTAAKDTNCDGAPDGDFGDVNLIQMAPTECVIMNIQAENSSDNEAISVILKDPIPEFTTYKTDTLQYCKGGDCTLEKFTDAIDNDSAEYDETNGEARFKAGTMASGKKASARFSIVID